MQWAAEHIDEVDWQYVRAGMPDWQQLPAWRVAGHLYAMLVDGLSSDQRKELDDMLAGQEQRNAKAEALRQVGMSEAEIDARRRMAAGSTPQERAAARAKAALAARERRARETREREQG